MLVVSTLRKHGEIHEMSAVSQEQIIGGRLVSAMSGKANDLGWQVVVEALAGCPLLRYPPDGKADLKVQRQHEGDGSEVFFIHHPSPLVCRTCVCAAGLSEIIDIHLLVLKRVKSLAHLPNLKLCGKELSLQASTQCVKRLFQGQAIDEMAVPLRF